MNRDDRFQDAPRFVTSLPIVDPARRQSPRVPVAAKVSLREGQTPARGQALNIGLGGIAVEGIAAPPIGDWTTIVIDLPSSEPLPFVGVVRWATNDAFGLQFGPLGGLQTRLIVELLRQSHDFR